MRVCSHNTTDMKKVISLTYLTIEQVYELMESRQDFNSDDIRKNGSHYRLAFIDQESGLGEYVVLDITSQTIVQYVWNYCGFFELAMDQLFSIEDTENISLKQFREEMSIWF